jgi:hypothetical protein
LAFSVNGDGGLSVDPGGPGLDARVPSSGAASASVASGDETQQIPSVVLIGGHDRSSGCFLPDKDEIDTRFQQISGETRSLYLAITVFGKLGADEVAETTASGLLATN